MSLFDTISRYSILVPKAGELIENLLKKYDIKIGQFLPEIDVALLGEFSVGKTALLNALLGTEQLFKESMARETKIATKVYYTSEKNNFYTLEYSNKEKQSSKYPFTMPFDTKQFGEDVKAANVHLNSYPMKEYYQAKLYFTDLPGTNSGNSYHDTVINDTIILSNVLLVCVPADTGNISESLFEKLLGIKKTNENMLIIGVITKSSLSRDNGAAICKLLEKTLKNRINSSKLIGCVTTDALDGNIYQLKSVLLKSYQLYNFRLAIPNIIRKFIFDIQNNFTLHDVFEVAIKLKETANKHILIT